MMFDRLEAYWVLPDGKSFERSDEDENAIGLFEVLLASVDAIPSSLTSRRTSRRRARKIQRCVVARSGIGSLWIFASERH
jgi:hypothetical protein